MENNPVLDMDGIAPDTIDLVSIDFEPAEKSNNPTCYLSPKLEGRECVPKGAKGVFARVLISEGELLALWGGEVIDGEKLSRLPRVVRRLSLQIEENLFFLSSSQGPADWINHSCDPNAGVQGQAALFALRQIFSGEEICFDYAMTDGSPYDEFDCHCGSPLCRGRITGDDWRRSDLWDRYKGYFSTYLQRRIDQLRGSGVSPHSAYANPQAPGR